MKPGAKKQQRDAAARATLEARVAAQKAHVNALVLAADTPHLRAHVKQRWAALARVRAARAHLAALEAQGAAA